MHRRIPAEDWNLWIGHAEPHKRTAHDVDTPWALSVIVPNNEAIHITSRHGRRVVTGPCTELLEYEERLTALALSDGPSKDGSQVTCVLRQRPMADRVHARMEAPQTIGLEPPRDCLPAEAEPDQLRPRNHPVLPRGQGRECSIPRVWAPICTSA